MDSSRSARVTSHKFVFSVDARLRAAVNEVEARRDAQQEALVSAVRREMQAIVDKAIADRDEYHALFLKVS